MARADSDTVEIKGMIMSLNANYTYVHERWEFPQGNAKQPPPPPTTMIPKMQLDPENIRVAFVTASPETGKIELSPTQTNANNGNIIMRRDDVKRLNLTVGDKITLRVTKE